MNTLKRCIAFCLAIYLSVITTGECKVVHAVTSQDTSQKRNTGCVGIKYEPRSPVISSGGVDITSVSDFSPKKLKNGWMTFDHIGYKDTAFQGERHVASMDDGMMFFGYDQEPLTDLIIMEHPAGENQTINTVQTPVRADWHTLNGNGVLFGCSYTGYVPNADVNTTSGGGKVATISGYSVVATISTVEVRQYDGVTYNNIGESFNVLYSEPKRCPGQNITIEITNGHAKVFISTRKIFEFDLGTDARGTGLVTTYQEHNCPSLSSVIMMNHTVNGIDYFKSR